MWIRRLEVTHCAGIAAAGIDLAPGLNVLHGPNELGKSSLVAAIRAALLLQSSATAADALRDWNTVESPTVSLTFEQETGRIWRVRKTFGRGGNAYLDFSKDGADFATESKGREVDGTLQDLLRWGIEAPGGRGGRRGMPSSLISTALLGEQSDVVAILEASLSGDASTSGRDRLTEALQALAEDPRFKQVVGAVQEKVDEAFTATGRRRTGRGSPWANLREQRENAAARQRDIERLVDESTGVRNQVEELSAKLLEARAEAERLTTTVSRRRSRDDAERRLAAAEEYFKAVETALAQLAANQHAVATTRTQVDELAAQRATLVAALAVTTPAVAAARDQLRELESGADEQQRRLREQEAENRRLTLAQEFANHERRTADANGLVAIEAGIQATSDQIEALETALAEKRELLKQAREASEQDRDQLAGLELERAVAGYLAAQRIVESFKAERDTARKMSEQARELDREAAALRDGAESLHAPDDLEYERLRSAETQWRLAEAKRSVGFVTEVSLTRAADATAEVDGKSRPLRLVPDQPVELEADQDLKVEIAELITIHVRGGGRDLLAESEAAEERWQAASRPVFGRTSAKTLEELAALRKRADVLVGQADDLDRQSEAARQHAANLDQTEQRLVTATADRKRLRDAVAEFLDEGETVAELIDSLAGLRQSKNPPSSDGQRMQPDWEAKPRSRELESTRSDVAAISDEITRLEDGVRERDRLCDRMDNDIEASARELETRQQDHAAETARLAEKAEQAGDWRAFLASADAEGARLGEQVRAVQGELDAIRTQATAEVDAARQALDSLVKRETNEQQALQDKTDALDRMRRNLARLEGETGPLRVNAEGKDLQAAQAARDRARETLAAIPRGDDEEDLDALAQDAERAEGLVRTLDSDLRKAEGALEQMGGQYLEEQRQQVEDAVKALGIRERELEMDYGAWRLLRETLTDAEQSGAAHLGNALVEPVSRRVRALTDGRYGDLAIGPQLDASGIQLAGGERPFHALSVGTQEQIALLLRVAIAEALGTFVILDDQLTQSDARRMGWIRELLAETSRSVQVVVLTCHPDDYGIGGTGHVVDLTQCLIRSDAPAAGGTTRTSDLQPGRKSPSRRRRRQPGESEPAGDDLAAALRESLEKRQP